MKLLTELLAKVRRMNDEESDTDAELDDLFNFGDDELEDPDGQLPGDEIDDSVGDDVEGVETDGEVDPLDADGELDMDSFGDDETGELEDSADAHPELDDTVDQATESPSKQGLIRTVPKAHLVYKREGEDGKYEELWIYNVTPARGEVSVKRAILAGTDIPPHKQCSPDEEQKYKVWSSGNAEMLLITGLPN